jgi:hypothetical protein
MLLPHRRRPRWSSVPPHRCPLRLPRPTGQYRRPPLRAQAVALRRPSARPVLPRALPAAPFRHPLRPVLRSARVADPFHPRRAWAGVGPRRPRVGPALGVGTRSGPAGAPHPPAVVQAAPPAVLVAAPAVLVVAVADLSVAPAAAARLGVVPPAVVGGSRDAGRPSAGPDGVVGTLRSSSRRSSPPTPLRPLRCPKARSSSSGDRPRATSDRG